jgi:hypothetical protein
MDMEDKIGAIITLIIVIIVIIILVFRYKNITIEIIHQSGIVIDQNYEHWTTIEKKKIGDNVYYTPEDHYRYETKVKIDNEDVVFTDDRRSVYENTAKDQKVKVLRKDRYYKKKYTGTNYYIDIK